MEGQQLDRYQLQRYPYAQGNANGMRVGCQLGFLFCVVCTSCGDEATDDYGAACHSMEGIEIHGSGVEIESVMWDHSRIRSFWIDDDVLLSGNRFRGTEIFGGQLSARLLEANDMGSCVLCELVVHKRAAPRTAIRGSPMGNSRKRNEEKVNLDKELEGSAANVLGVDLRESSAKPIHLPHGRIACVRVRGIEKRRKGSKARGGVDKRASLVLSWKVPRRSVRILPRGMAGSDLRNQRCVDSLGLVVGGLLFL